MISKLQDHFSLLKEKSRTKLVFVFLFLISSLSCYGQFTFTEIPKDKQLYARSGSKGTVIIEGTYDKSGESLDYTDIRVVVYRQDQESIFYTDNKVINYTSDIGSWSKFIVDINAEPKNYSFEIQAKLSGGNWENIKTINEVVAGDVFIIQGQSNAEAFKYEGSANLIPNNFIRVYASGTDNEVDLIDNYDNWYIADGDVSRHKPGNTGQWGLKLANMILSDYGIPIAIFNGANGGKGIKYFLKDHDNGNLMNNYERLFYRLNKTGLKSAVKAVFWSQGENVGDYKTYYSQFKNLKDSWMSDYPNIEEFYIFQTDNNCTDAIDATMQIKEAQRLLSVDYTNIHIMTTAALNHYLDCHFKYSGGYESFAERIFELVNRDLYGGNAANDIDPPMITKAYLTNDTNLVIETDAFSLALEKQPATDFIIENAGNSEIENIQVSGSKIIFTLSEYPGASAMITYRGPFPDYFNRNFITNSKGIELVCFNKFAIEDKPEVLISSWNGSAWLPSAPDATMDAIIDSDYLAIEEGGFTTKDLTINDGATLNFDSGTSHSVVVHGDLINNGTFVIGDQESLVMYKDDAKIEGVITKNESSTSRNNIHDFTYWSSPVENDTIKDVFPGVDPNRIFYYDQSKSTAVKDTEATYWDVWVSAVQNSTMDAGKGFAAEGNSDGVHEISFTGEPNNGKVSVDIVFQNDGKDNDFNLIGNPYPSAINIDTFFDENSNIVDPVIYLWTHNTAISNGDSGDFKSDDYATYNYMGGSGTSGAKSGGEPPKSNIGSGQGFFVRALNSGSVIFNNAMRIEDANDQFFKADISKVKKKDVNKVQKDRIWLNLTTDQGGFNQILIGFIEGATKGIDRGYDALKFKNSSNPISFYSVIGKDKYTIQGLSEFKNSKKVSLGFDTDVAPRLFTVSIFKTEGTLKSANIYIEDKELHITHDLKKSDYIFEQATTGEFMDRFVLKFKNNQIFNNVKDVYTNNFKVYYTDYGIEVQATDIMKKVKIYNFSGRKLIDAEPNSKEFSLKLNSAKKHTLLLMDVIFENGSRKNKKVIKTQ